jgi:pyruvate formate lyase activating enzyme
VNRRPGDLRIGGLAPLTTLDYPGRLAAVVFCQGCPWRCRYCHNPALLDARASTLHDWHDVTGLLERRVGLLDGVVFSGGEPTLQRALPAAIDAVAAQGFHVGLHTAGAYPHRLARVLPRVDWVGLDIKALAEDYPATTGVPGSGERAWRSLELVRDSGVPFDVRITRHPALLPDERLARLRARLAEHGISAPSLQACNRETMRDPALG